MRGGAATLDIAPPEAEPVNPDNADRMANGTLMVRWAHETRAMLVMEFIAEKHLFGELNKFLKRKIR